MWLTGGRRGTVTLSRILEFVTGADHEPVLGFGIPPSIAFVEYQESFIPTANTCICSLNLPRASTHVSLPPQEKLFSLYDLAFCNNYFGMV